METVNFGTFLREERERRNISLAEISHSTKLSVTALKQMEEGNLEDLPPDVFVRGFIRSYAKSLGISSHAPLGMLDQILAERRRAAMPLVAVVTPTERKPVVEAMLPLDSQVEDDGQAPRRGIGLAVFVIIVLLIATITLSLFLRQQPPSGEGLSLEHGTPAASVLTTARPG
jgi:cytoskeletal protein RodZ